MREKHSCVRPLPLTHLYLGAPLLTPDVRVFHTPTRSGTPAGCPNRPGGSGRSQGVRVVPQDRPFRCQSHIQAVTCASV